MTERPEDTMRTLEQEGLQLSEVTRLVTALEAADPSARTVTFGISGNVTIDLLETYLRKHAVLHRLRASVMVGALDDHIGNVKRFKADGCDVIVLLDLFDAILPALEARIDSFDDEQVTGLIARYRDALAVALEEAVDVGHVFIGRPHRLSRPRPGSPDPIDAAVARLDAAVTEVAAPFANVEFVSGSAIGARLGWDHAFSTRSYARFRAPFTPAFFDLVAAQAFVSTRAFGSYFYKALALDCDGTLWGGTLGEDLADGIKLGPFSYPGNVYWRLQHEFLRLQRGGALLCLSSKNDPADVDAVLASHPDMVIRDEHIVARRVNWDDKVIGLESLAEELGIGLEAMVFVDDSPFECENVRTRLPMVETIQIPTDLGEIGAVVERLDVLFVAGHPTADGAVKTAQYRARAQAIDAQAAAPSQADYLASLGLVVEIRRDDRGSAARIAELTQKSNQFNLTTHRLTLADIEGLMAADDHDVFSIHVSDRFGDAGLTGVLISDRSEPGTMRIDTFLMSCRVLGRGIEYSIWESIRRRSQASDDGRWTAEYEPTPKNGQVRDFWDRLGLKMTGEDERGHRSYSSDLDSMTLAQTPSYIEVNDAI